MRRQNVIFLLLLFLPFPLLQFLLPGEARGRHVTATDAQSGASTIYVDEFSFDEAADRQNLPWLVS